MGSWLGPLLHSEGAGLSTGRVQLKAGVPGIVEWGAPSGVPRGRSGEHRSGGGGGASQSLWGQWGEGVWEGCDVSSRFPAAGAEERPWGHQDSLLCFHFFRWEKLEHVGVLAGRIPQRTWEQPRVGGGRVGLWGGAGGEGRTAGRGPRR